MDDGCVGVAGLLFGHKFEPRYNKIDKKGVGTWPKGVSGSAGVLNDMMGLTQPTEHKELYVCDVCVRCGGIVESEYDMNNESTADDNERLAVDMEERKHD